MYEASDDDLLLDMIESISLDVLRQIGSDPEARYLFFRRFLALAKETIRQVDDGRGTSPN